MLKAMVFLDYENFEISKTNYFWSLTPEGEKPLFNKIDYNLLPQKVVDRLRIPHVLTKTFMFAPKPDEFLMQDPKRQNTYNWLSGMKNQYHFTLIEGTHSARPVPGYTYQTMSIDNPASYYVVEKGTDVNLTAHLITKGFMDAYDTAIVMSGDADYIPVLDILNTLGKTVVVVGVKNQNMTRLRQHADELILLDKDFFDTCMRHQY